MPTQPPSEPLRERDVQPFQAGALVGQRYRVEKLIREDDLGWVYAVSETGPSVVPDGAKQPLALRLLRPRFSGDDFALSAEARKQWRSQLSRLRDLRHPGIVPVFDVCLGDEQGRVYSVRAAVELLGQPLQTALQARTGGLPEPEAVRLCASIAEAVESAHQYGVQHLALSPQHVFVVPAGETVQIRVADFALMPPQLAARYCEPGYLAPEQIENQPCDRRTDQFSLAVMFYEMLGGQPAFIGAPDEDRQIILRRVVSEDPLPLALSRPIELALSRALSRSRAVRFPSLNDFVGALGIDGVAWGMVRPPGPARSQFSPLPRTRTPLYVPVLLGAFAASCALGVYFYLSSGGMRVRQPPPVPPVVAARPDLAPPPSPDLAAAEVADLAAPPPPDLAVIPDLLPVPVAKPPVKNSPPGPNPANANQAIVVAPMPSINDIDIQITTDGPPLSAAHLERVKYCVLLVRPRPPFSVVLEPFRSTLFVSSNSATAELRESNDFRNCLKNEVQGNIEAKDVYVKGILRGKTAP